MKDYKKRKIIDILSKYSDSKEALVLTGFRRVGKTTVMRQIFDSISSPNKLFLDLESPVNQKIFTQENYDNVKRNLESLGLNFEKKVHLFLDEIQLIRNVTSVIKYLYDHNNIKFYLTGSSSFYLKGRFSESMAGRKFVFELHPLDFEEFIWFKEKKLNLKSLMGVSFDAQYEYLSGLYSEYLQFGGFPGVVIKDSLEEKIQALDDVLGSYFQLDVKSLASFRDNNNLKALMFLLSSRVGSKVEVTKVSESLGVSRQTVYDYLNFFEQTYFIGFLKAFSGSRDIIVKQNPKVYFVDTGILNRVSKVSESQIFENKVFNQFSTHLSYKNTTGLYSPLNYYQSKYGRELDFILEGKTAYEVKVRGGVYDLNDAERTASKLAIKDVKVIILQEPKISNPRIIFPYFL